MSRQGLGFGQKLMTMLTRKRGLIDSIRPKGKFVIEHYRHGKKIGEYELNNGICNAGINWLLDIVFNGGSGVSTMYIGIIDNSSYTGVAASDTASSHSGWIEFTSYQISSVSVRGSWNPGAAASQSVTNSTPETFDITGSGTLKGIFLDTTSTQGGTGGLLWSTALFTSTIAVVNGDQLKITYTLTGA